MIALPTDVAPAILQGHVLDVLCSLPENSESAAFAREKVVRAQGATLTAFEEAPA